MTKSLDKRNFTEGPLFMKIFLFAVPLMLSGLLQVGYNMADNIVVGKFSSDPIALAAVGSSSVYNAVIVNFLLGFSVGAGVVVAQFFGRGDEEGVRRSVHTSMLISLISGVALGALGYVFTRPVLLLLDTKAELIDAATTYMHILCIGIPASVIYNFGSSVLRSLGDSKSALYILAGSGILNVLLNLFFVIVCDMAVKGVALATIISEYLSAIFVVAVMMMQKGASRFRPAKMALDRSITLSIIKLGLPAGLCNSLFTVSSMLITKAINTFSVETIYARTVVQNVDLLVTTVVTSYSRSALTFVAQNHGAGKLDRIKKSFWYSMIQMLILTVLISQIILLFYRPIASLYIGENNENPELILDIAGDLFRVLLNTYFTCGIMNILESTLRGIKYSLTPSIVSVFTIIVFRVVWVYFVFPYEPFNTAASLMASFPISWVLASIAYTVILLIAWRKLKKTLHNE